MKFGCGVVGGCITDVVRSTINYRSTHMRIDIVVGILDVQSF